MLSEDLDPHEFYQLIEIRIFPANSEGRYPVELNVQGGRNFAQATLQLNLERLNGLDAYPKAYGRLLGEALFADDVLGTAYRETRAVAQGRGKGLRVCLRLDASELQAIHWERIYHPFDGNWHPLGNTADTPFSRYIPAPSWKSQRLITERPLKVLAVIASPTNLGRYALDPLAQSERVALHTSLDGLSDVIVTYLETGTPNLPTLNQLRKVLADGYHLVHFLCHGAVTGGGTILYLEDDHGNVGHVTTDELVGLFNDLRDPPVFCFLAACESATRAANDAFAPLGPTLVQHGNIQAVVAMTDRVGVVTAQRFADQFYKRLLHHGIVDLAVNEARALIQDEWDWGAPTLFTHLKHGQLLSQVKDDISDVYVAHPYALLDTKDLVGRKSELQLLTDWVTKSDEDIDKVRIVSIVAIGGMGKSALAWKWFNDIVPQTMKPLTGRMWWSFYEVDSSFEDFVTHALAFVSGQPNEKLQEIPLPEREARLLAILDKKPFLLVLDGLERIMLAYNRGDAAHMLDDNLDDQAANSIISIEGLPESISPSFTSKRDLHETSDPRAGMFLRKLASIHASRVLITTRLNPTKLQTITFEDLPGTKVIPLKGLDNDSAMELWQSLHLTGSRENMLPLFNSFENYPLLIRILAGTVAKYRNAPGNFDKWRTDKPDFDPFKQPLVNVKSHVLFFALQGLGKPARDVLYTVAAFRGPVAHDVISKLLIGGNKPCKDEGALDTILTELEDRGLLGWERKKNINRYDMHPTVRGVIWSGLDSKIQQRVYTELNTYFEAAFGKPRTWLKSFYDFSDDHWREVNDLEELSLAIEIYHTLIGLQRYDDAYYHFVHYLDDALQWRFAANYRITALLEMLFPDGVEQTRLGDETRRAAIENLAVAYEKSGKPGKAQMLFNQVKDLRVSIYGLYSQANTLLVIGKLYQAEVVAQQAVELSRKVGAISLFKDYSSFQLLSDKPLLDLAEGIYPEALSLHALALNLAARGMADDSRRVMNHCLSLIKDLRQPPMEGLTNAVFAQCEIWCGDDKAAQPMAEKAWSLAQHELVEPHLIRAARLQGEAALGMKELPKAEERLYHALDRARKASYVEEELSALVGLAKLQLLKGDHTSSRERLNDVWEFAEHGPFPLIHVHALNVLAQLERDANNHEHAIEAATRAMRLAWCDGPPFIYHRGLLEAQELLSELGASIPSDLPPFDFSQADEISHEQDRLREETMISSANQMLQQARNQEDLLITCKKLVNENPKDALAHYCLGRVYYESERYQEAIEALQRLSQLEPAFGLPYFTLSLIFEKIDLVNDALSTSEKAVKLNSMNLNYLYQLFRMYYIAENKDVAVQTLKHMIRLSPGTIYYYQLLADMSYEMERPEEALDMFSFAIGNEVNIVEAYIGRADLLRKLGRLKEALKDLEHAEAMNREVNPFRRKFECWMYFLQALVLMALKRKSEAKSQLMRAARSVDDLLNSKDQLTENGRCYLSYQKAIYLLVGKQPKEALDLFSSTAEKYGNTNVRDALDDLDRYLQVFPNDKTAQDAHRLLFTFRLTGSTRTAKEVP